MQHVALVFMISQLHSNPDIISLLLLLVCVSSIITGQPRNSTFIRTECSRDKPLFSFVRGQDSTMWDIVWVSPQGHRSVSVSCHFFLQAPQCPCSVRKQFSRDHCCRGRSKPGCRIVGSHTRWQLNQSTEAWSIPVTVLASAMSVSVEPSSMLLMTTVLTPVLNNCFIASAADDKSVISSPVSSLHSHPTSSLLLVLLVY